MLIFRTVNVKLDEDVRKTNVLPRQSRKAAPCSLPLTARTSTKTDVRVHRGRRTVAEIKTAGGVPLAYELDQIVEGKLVPLEDDGAVTIKGGERFSSQPRTGQSS